jgi:hypothetical protein
LAAIGGPPKLPVDDTPNSRVSMGRYGHKIGFDKAWWQISPVRKVRIGMPRLIIDDAADRCRVRPAFSRTGQSSRRP